MRRVAAAGGDQRDEHERDEQAGAPGHRRHCRKGTRPESGARWYRPRPVDRDAWTSSCEILTAGTVHCIDTDELRTKLAIGPAAAGEARHRPHRVRHPPRPYGRSAQTAPVPGSRTPRGADHRRLHRAGRRSHRAVGHPAAADRRRGRGPRPHLRRPGAGRPRLRPRTASSWCATPTGWRAMDMADVLRLTGRTTVARIMERDDFSQRFRDGVADRAVRAALPAAPGHRLGRGPGRRRARRHRPAVQQPHGPPAPVRRGHGAAGRDHHAAARGPRRREEDVEVARQLRRDQRAGRPSSSASS